jgi:hypothetical protein
VQIQVGRCGIFARVRFFGLDLFIRCTFTVRRNTDRNIVLAHVKEHYTSNAQNAASSNSHNFASSDKVSSSMDAVDSMNGESKYCSSVPYPTVFFYDYIADLRVSKNVNLLFFSDHTSVNGIIRCNLCHFETDNQTTFRIHNSHHVEDPSATFKCCFCPFFANDKQ